MSQTTHWPVGLGQAIGARVTRRKPGELGFAVLEVAFG